MTPTIKLPNEILEEKEYKHLSPQDKANYLERTMSKILDINTDTGVSIPLILENTYFDRKGISKYLEKLVAKRIAYKIQQGKTIIYFKNGRLIHHLFNKNIEIGNRLYSFKALFDGKQISIYIQESKKNVLGVIEEGGGIIVPLNDIKDFSLYVNKIKEEIPIIKEEFVRMIE